MGHFNHLGKAMSHYLKDKQITNTSVTEEGLAQICAVFAERASTLNALLPEDDTSGKKAILSYVIRFDNKGYRVFSIDDLLRYFRQATSVERVIFTVETSESLRSNRQMGTLLEMRLDEKDPTTCFLTVTSDDKDWVDASFSAVEDSLAKLKNRNGWARTAGMAFGVQLIGVTLGFVLSLWAATKVAPKLSIENSFVFSFLFVLLIFSNTWTFLNQVVMRLIHASFPNIKFLRSDKERLHWLPQAVIGGTVAAAALFVLGQAAAFILELLGAIVGNNA